MATRDAEVQNISQVVVYVAGLSVAPNRIAHIPWNHWHAWLSTSSANRETAQQRLRVVHAGGLQHEQEPEDEAPSPAPDPEPPADPGPVPPGGDDEDELTPREQRLGDAIASLDATDERLWTVDGRPKLAAVRVFEGLSDISLRELELAWERAHG